MNPRNPFIVAATIFFVGFSLVAAYVAFQVLGLTVMLFILILFALGILLAYQSRLELIDEMEVGVVFNRFNNSFCRFVISPEPNPDHDCRDYRFPRWIPFGLVGLMFDDPYHARLRWHEELTGRIPKKSQSTSGKLENIRTSDGIAVSIPWKVSYTVDVSLIPPFLRHKMARVLPDFSDKVVTGRAERVLKHLIETQTIESLYQANALQTLEVQVSQNLYRQLSNPNLGFKNIPPKDVVLGPIEMPRDVEKALETAHQRMIHTKMVSEAMERLHLAIDNFNDADMKRLEQLEKLRILDGKDVESLHLAKVFVGKQD
ncbi:SPFH domain-containing protein [Candidatus Leptofilum sp.]|uniref:SPFH domain-containing protein n=1 Tax=Candidatus Leptofilum sp. TaxID=3241576 RepID=UPI003B5A1B1A